MLHPETIVATPLGMYEALSPSLKITGVHLNSLSKGPDSVVWAPPVRSLPPVPMFEVMTEAGYSVRLCGDASVITYDTAPESTPVKDCQDKRAMVFIGFAEDTGLSTPSRDMAMRAGLLDCRRAPLPVLKGDISVRLSWIRGVVEGFGFIARESLYFPDSKILQTVLLSVGIPSIKDDAGLSIPHFWIHEFCQFIQPSALRQDLMRILNNSTYIPQYTPHGNRQDLLESGHSYFRNFARSVFLSRITSVKGIEPAYGYRWAASEGIATVADGILVS